jgi:lipoate-protein ligase A
LSFITDLFNFNPMKPRLQALRSGDDYPPINIAVEELLRAGLNDVPGYLLTSVNAPSVVIGRNQHPEYELSPHGSDGQPIPVFRRTSGGGAVFHDQGNLNWTFVVPGGLEDRAGLLAIVVEVLRNLGIPASSGSRGEIMAGGYKIGGTASAAGRGILMFHGTLLVNADLDLLVRVLAAHQSSYIRKISADPSQRGIASVPSPVGNATWFHQGLQTSDLAKALAEATGGSQPIDWPAVIDTDAVDKLAETYASRSWIYRTTQKGTP